MFQTPAECDHTDFAAIQAEQYENGRWLLELLESNLSYEILRDKNGIGAIELNSLKPMLSMIFKTVETKKLRAETKYLAIAILQQFLYEYLRSNLQLNKYEHFSKDAKKMSSSPVMNSTYSFEILRCKYDIFCQDIGKSLIVWLMSSIQIASKLTSSHHILRNGSIQKILRKHGIVTSLSSLARHELILLRNVCFRVPRVTIFDQIQFLLEKIEEMQSQTAAELISRLLDYVYLDRGFMVETCSSQPSQTRENQDFNILEVSGIVAFVSTYLISPEHCDLILMRVYELYGQDPDIISHKSQLLMKQIFDFENEE